MKYVILIHSNPQPWGHPTGEFVAENQALPQAERERLNADFEALLTELSSSGELKGGEALGAPSDARLFRWDAGAAVATDGPYAEAKEHLAGFFLVEAKDIDEACAIAARFPPARLGTIEVRPVQELQHSRSRPRP